MIAGPRWAAPRPLAPVTPGTTVGFGERIRRWRSGADRSALPLVLELLARELRAGATVPVALRTIADAEPAADSLRPIVERVDRGALVGDELDRWAAGFDTDDARLARSVLRLGLSTGAALADSLDRLGATVRDRVELDDELRALTAQSRASAVVLALAPAAFLLILGLIDPGMLVPLVSTSLGWLCLVVGLLLDAFGFWWMRRLVSRIDR